MRTSKAYAADNVSRALSMKGAMETDLELIALVDTLYSHFVDTHGTLGKTMFLLELAIHQEQALGILGRTFERGFLEQVSRALHLGATKALNELGQVGIEQLELDGVIKEVESSLIHLEGFFKVVILFQECCVVDDHLGVGNLEIKNLVVDALGALDVAQALLEISSVAPDLQALKQTRLTGQGLDSMLSAMFQIGVVGSNAPRHGS